MNKIRLGFFNFLAATALFLFCSWSALGQVDRAWVSGVGNDANPCSRTAPCRTFAGAISKVNPGGEINVLDQGGYGGVVITKSVTIDATGVYASMTSLTNADAVTINAGANDVVVLRHLSIHSQTDSRNGIKFNSGKALYLEDLFIKNFPDYGVDFEPSSGGALFIRDSNIINNGKQTFSPLLITRGSGGGVMVKSARGTAFASIDNSRVDGNFIGINARDNSKVTVSNSAIAKNSSIGLLTFTDSNSPAEMNVEHSVVTLNQVGIEAGGCSTAQVSGSATVRISNVNVTSNNASGLLSGCAAGRSGGPAAIISAKNNTIMGNNPDGAPTSTTPQQ